jgi:hypothetical protein
MEDWNCPHCETWNQSYLFQCRQCGQPRLQAENLQEEEAGQFEPAKAEQVRPVQRAQPARPKRADPATDTPRVNIHPEPEPAPGACQLCGRRPAALFSFRGSQGMVFVRRTYHFDGCLCRSCATGEFRKMQTRNLSWGWFGLISFAATIVYAFGNVASYRRGRRGLAEPSPADATKDKRLRGRPVIWGVLPRLVPILVLIGAVAWIGVSTGQKTGVEGSYLNSLPGINSARNHLYEVAKEKWDTYSSGTMAAPPRAEDLVATELEAFLEQVEAMTPPASGALLAYHRGWLVSVQELVKAEQALVLDYSEAAVLADNLAWSKEDAAYTPVLDYYNSHL